MQKCLTLLLPFFVLAAGLPLAGQPAQPPKLPAAVPQYNDKGELKRPVDYRTWVFVGSNIGLGYQKEPAPIKDKEDQKPAGSGDFHNVYINPQAYEHYARTGRFPENTMLVMDVYEAQHTEPQNIVSKGYFPGKQLHIEVAVKNNQRPDGGKKDWAYYAFPAKQASAKAFPDSRCYDCHLKHAGDDNVWVQFYPTLRMLQKEQKEKAPTKAGSKTAPGLNDRAGIGSNQTSEVSKTSEVLPTTCCRFAHGDLAAIDYSRVVGADWPAFRGPGHQGQAGAGEYPVRWGPQENVAWKVKLPGPGASSPVVQGQRVFVTCFTGKKAPELARYLVCLDRKTGKILWQQQRPAPQPENDYAKQLLQHGFATGTPIVEGDRVYVNFCRGGVFAFDLEGKEIWQRELGKYLNSFGSGSSPSLYGDLLLLNATVEAGALFALNKTNGQIVWKAKIPGDCWATPVVVETAKGEKEIVLNGQLGLYGFDPDSGKELWFCKTVGGYVSSTPVMHKDVLYVTGSNFERRMVLAVRAGGQGDVSKTHVVWTNAKVGASYCSPLVLGDHLFFFSGQATCLNRLTGEVVAQQRLDGVTQLYSSPIVAGGKIYLCTRDQGAYVLSADEKMTVLAHNDLGDTSTINSSPAASGGDLFIRSPAYLYCLRNK